jgi:cell division protein FtsB
MRADLRDLDERLEAQEDSLEQVSQEERELHKEMKSLDMQECPKCGYRWSEEQ